MLKEKISAVCSLWNGVANVASFAADVAKQLDDSLVDDNLDALPCVDIVTPVGIYMVSVHCSATTFLSQSQ